jgi:hypothetical protein
VLHITDSILMSFLLCFIYLFIFSNVLCFSQPSPETCEVMNDPNVIADKDKGVKYSDLPNLRYVFQSYHHACSLMFQPVIIVQSSSIFLALKVEMVIFYFRNGVHIFRRPI